MPKAVQYLVWGLVISGVLAAIAGAISEMPDPIDMPAADMQHDTLHTQDGWDVERWIDYDQGVVCYSMHRGLSCLPLEAKAY